MWVRVKEHVLFGSRDFVKNTALQLPGSHSARDSIQNEAGSPDNLFKLELKTDGPLSMSHKRKTNRAYARRRI